MQGKVTPRSLPPKIFVASLRNGLWWGKSMCRQWGEQHQTLLRELLGGPEGPGAVPSRMIPCSWIPWAGSPWAEGHLSITEAPGQLMTQSRFVTQGLDRQQWEERRGGLFGRCCFNDSPSLPSLGISNAAVMTLLPLVWFWTALDWSLGWGLSSILPPSQLCRKVVKF